MPPTFMQGDLSAHFDDREALLLFTANGVISPTTGRLALRSGFARQVNDAFPSIAYELGQGIIARGCFRSGIVFTYHLEIHRRWTGRLIGAFQVKYHWRWPASLDLIATSVTRLKMWCDTHPGVAVHLNYPGIGLGELTPAQVAPLLAILPPRVHVYRLEPESESEAVP